MSLFVGQLSQDISTEELRELFEQYGALNRCELKAGTRVDFAFLTFENEEDASAAIDAMHGKEIKGYKLNVEKARGKRERTNGCYTCGKPGHFARDCYNRSPRRNDRYRSRSPERSPRRGYYRSPPRYSRSDNYRRSPSPKHRRERSPYYRSRSPRRYGRGRSPSPKDYGRERSPSPYYRGKSPKRYGRDRSPSPKDYGRERGGKRSPSPSPRRDPYPASPKDIPSPDFSNRTPSDLKRPFKGPKDEEPPEKRARTGE